MILYFVLRLALRCLHHPSITLLFAMNTCIIISTITYANNPFKHRANTSIQTSEGEKDGGERGREKGRKRVGKSEGKRGREI